MSDRLLDGPAFAQLIHVRPHTVRMWAVRRLIHRVGVDQHGRAVYRLDELLELATRLGHIPSEDDQEGLW